MKADQATYSPRGRVEIDGCRVGGHVKPTNYKEDRVDRRLAKNQTGKRRVVVAMVERGGRVLPFVASSEADAVPTIRSRVLRGSTVNADGAACWDELHGSYAAKRINHGFAF